jgi:RNA polymerase sigma factor (sigma-70 family)
MTEARADHELVRGALANDASARRELVTRLLPVVRARVMHALLRYKAREQAAQATDDLTQQVFLLLFDDGGRRLRAWEPGRGAALTTFVALVAEREVIGILRRGRRNPWTESPTEHDELVGRAGAGASFESAVEDRELLNAVLDRALAGLDERGLLLFQRLVVEEAPVDAVASELGASCAALYMWRSRFAKSVREVAEALAAEPAPAPAEPRGTSPSASLLLQAAWRAR